MMFPMLPFAPFRSRYPRPVYSPLQPCAAPSSCVDEPKLLPPVDEVDDNVLFEIMGIKLHLDDLIILGLLYFLYSQEVDDISLYIVLILLLLS